MISSSMLLSKVGL